MELVASVTLHPPVPQRAPVPIPQKAGCVPEPSLVVTNKGALPNLQSVTLRSFNPNLSQYWQLCHG